MQLFAHYGISNNDHKWPLLALALLSGLTPAFKHMQQSPGRPGVVPHPDLLYSTIIAIQAVASNRGNSLNLPDDLQTLAKAIGEESAIQTLHPSKRVKAICARLKAKRGNHWSGINEQTLRSTYNTQKKLAEAAKKDLDALS